MKTTDIHFTDTNGKEFTIQIVLENNEISEVKVHKNKEEIVDVRFYNVNDY